MGREERRIGRDAQRAEDRNVLVGLGGVGVFSFGAYLVLAGPWIVGLVLGAVGWARASGFEV